MTIPPLRERTLDVPLLAESFFRTLQLKSGKDIRTVSRRAMDLPMAYSWPGNVRELRSTFEHAFVTCQTTSIEPEALRETEGIQSRAAKILGISQVAVWNRMKRYGVRAIRQVTE